jgi:hypothetical protein
MAIDVSRVVGAAVQAALEPAPQPTKPKKRRLPFGRAVVVGAGLFTAGRLIAGPKGRELFASVQDRLAEWEPVDEEDQDVDGYDEDEEPEEDVDEDLDEEDVDEEDLAEDEA